MPEELVYIVDDGDNVTATVTRSTMRAGRLKHRCVAIAVVSTDGRVLIHRRSDDKDIWPGWWDIAAGGVVTAGETYEQAAQRELAEELGVVAVNMEHLGDGRYADGELTAVYRVYRVVHDGPFTFADGEVAEARWVSFAELHEMRAGHRFVPDSIAVVLSLIAVT